MEPEAKYKLVGTAVLALFAGAVAFAVWFSQASGGRNQAFYTVYFRQHSLSGLQVDSEVTMRGIRVGSVSSVNILTDDIERVRVVVRVDPSTPVKEDTQAVINRNLLTGLAGIDLINSSQGSPLLILTPEADRFPVIPEGAAKLEEAVATLPSILDRADQLLQKAGSIVSPTNQEAVSSILKNIESIVAGFAKNDDVLKRDLQNLIARSTDLVQRMDTSVKQVSSTFTESSKGLKTSSDQLVSELANLSRDIRRALTTVTNTLERFENPRNLIVGPSEKALGPGEKVR